MADRFVQSIAAANDEKVEQAGTDPQAPKKKDVPSPDSAPIKPGAPRIEVGYEWHKD